MCMPLQRSKDAALKKVAQETTIFLQNNLFFLFSKRLNTNFFFFLIPQLFSELHLRCLHLLNYT